MLPILVSFFVGLGIGTWMYNKSYGRTGGNTQSAIIAGGIVGFMAFLAIFFVANRFLSS